MVVQHKHWNYINERLKFMKKGSKNVSITKTRVELFLANNSNYLMMTARGKGDKSVSKTKMAADPLFEKIVDEV